MLKDEMNFPEINRKDFEGYRRIKPPGSADAIENAISKTGKYVCLFQTEVGQLILKDMLPMIEKRIISLIDGNLNDEGRIELKVMLFLCERWNGMIKTYVSKCDELKKNIVKG